jgi:heptosyltransferase-2
MMALLASCAFLVTNDSGPMHIAAALGTPLTAIFGPTEWLRTSPLTARARLVRADDIACAPCKRRECDREHVCMLGVTPEMVIDASIGLRREVAGG